MVFNVFRTNFVEVLSTNWAAVNLTNHVNVALVRTNFVQSFQTNWTTLNLTNWETVVVIKTNWITHPVTNLVQVDLTRNGFVASDSTIPKETGREQEVQTSRPVSLAPAQPGTPLVLEAARTARPAANNLVEVQLKVRWANDATAPLLVQQWRVESADGTVFCFGQDRDFKRELPVGTYKVEVKVQREATSAVLAARGTLALTARAATIQPKLTAQR